MRFAVCGKLVFGNALVLIAVVVLHRVRLLQGWVNVYQVFEQVADKSPTILFYSEFG